MGQTKRPNIVPHGGKYVLFVCTCLNANVNETRLVITEGPPYAGTQLQSDIASAVTAAPTERKTEVLPVLNFPSTKPRRYMGGECMCRSTFSLSRHELEVSPQLHASTALPQGKEPSVLHNWK